jgi:hypothetical protein
LFLLIKKKTPLGGRTDQAVIPPQTYVPQKEDHKTLFDFRQKSLLVYLGSMLAKFYFGLLPVDVG